MIQYLNKSQLLYQFCFLISLSILLHLFFHHLLRGYDNILDEFSQTQKPMGYQYILYILSKYIIQ